MSFVTDLTFWQYFVPGVLYGAFVVLYATRSPGWRDTPIGRALMMLALSLASVFTFICLVLAVEIPSDIRDLLRTLLIGGVTIAGALMLKNLLREQHQARMEETERNGSD